MSSNLQEQNPVSSTTRILSIVFAIAMVVLCAIINRVLYKMALVPLENYIFFLAQFQTFGYVLVYATVLMVQNYRKSLHPKAWDVPRKFRGTLLAIGFV